MKRIAAVKSCLLRYGENPRIQELVRWTALSPRLVNGNLVFSVSIHSQDPDSVCLV